MVVIDNFNQEKENYHRMFTEEETHEDIKEWDAETIIDLYRDGVYRSYIGAKLGVIYQMVTLNIRGQLIPESVKKDRLTYAYFTKTGKHLWVSIPIDKQYFINELDCTEKGSDYYKEFIKYNLSELFTGHIEEQEMLYNVYKGDINSRIRGISRDIFREDVARYLQNKPDSDRKEVFDSLLAEMNLFINEDIGRRQQLSADQKDKLSYEFKKAIYWGLIGYLGYPREYEKYTATINK